MENDSEILQDIIDLLNSGDSPTRILATRHNVLDVFDTLLKDYRDMMTRVADTAEELREMWAALQ